MIPPLSKSTTLPPLKSPERRQLQSRLESGLVKLAQLASTPIDPPKDDQSEVPDYSEKSKASWLDLQRTIESDRRAFPRRGGRCRVVVCRWSHEHETTPQQIEWRLHSSPVKGDLVNLSMNGAALILPHEFSKEEIIVVRLRDPLRGVSLDQRAKVVDNLPNGSSQFRVLCQFLNRLSLDQVALFRRFFEDPRWI